MAQPSKVREFLKSPNTEEDFLAMGKVVADHLAAALLASSDKKGYVMAQVMSKFWEHIGPLMHEQVTKLIGEQFTDDDLDQIAAYRSSPVAKKAREAIPQFQQQLSTFLIDNEKEMRRTIAEILDEVTRG